MAYIHTFAVIFPLIAVTIFVFAKNPKIRPNFNGFSLKHSKKVLSLGSIFFFVQFFYMLIMNTNEYLITLFIGSEYVVTYQVYNKFFVLFSSLFSLALAPIWSAITQAFAKKDLDWIRKLYKKLLLCGFCVLLCEFFIIPILQLLVNIWLGKGYIQIQYSIAFCFAMYGSLMLLTSIFSCITNGLGKLKVQFICYFAGFLTKLLVSYILTKFFNLWYGVIIGSSIALLIYCIVEPIKIKRYLSQEVIL